MNSEALQYTNLSRFSMKTDKIYRKYTLHKWYKNKQNAKCIGVKSYVNLIHRESFYMIK